ncbi:unnamed protein product [Prorocentrum cordatum]|uniref:Uncharacterized protein n=1 Tax=Prorocentrum cordatum TaxID=2364126 RepID=A0ABN9VYP8_9DINO|nr:unnamed protein product [Polarella glacialis]
MPRPRGQQPPGAGQTLPSDYWRDAVQRETLIRQRHGLFLDSRTADDSWYGVPDSFRVSASPIGMGLMVRGLCGPSEHRTPAGHQRAQRPAGLGLEPGAAAAAAREAAPRGHAGHHAEHSAGRNYAEFNMIWLPRSQPPQEARRARGRGGW